MVAENCLKSLNLSTTLYCSATRLVLHAQSAMQGTAATQRGPVLLMDA